MFTFLSFFISESGKKKTDNLFPILCHISKKEKKKTMIIHGPIIFFAINSMLIYKRILLFSRTVTDETNHERKCDVFHWKPDYWRNVSGLSVPVWHPNFLTPGTCGGKKFIGDKKYNMRWISEMRTPQWLPGTWLLAQALKNHINSVDSTQPINHTYTEPKIFKYLQGSKYMIGFGWGGY